MPITITQNQHNFMLITGKFLPDEDIKFDNIVYYFNQRNEEDNCIYHEDSTGAWEKREYKNNNCLYYENETGYWEKREYNNNDDCTYYGNSNGYWERMDTNGIVIESGQNL